MKKSTLSFLIAFFIMEVNAQISDTTATGEYYLRGVMETASGFKLDGDGSFQFFFSYGALDRFGKGKWVQKDNRVFLNSIETHDADFALINSKKTSEKGITIKVTDQNTNLLRYIYCEVQSGHTKQHAKANENGEFFFTLQEVDSLILLFEFCPEKETKIVIPMKGNNYFEFRIEPWLMEVYFKNFSLQLREPGLAGGHPIMEGSDYRYEKAGK
ncbi:MAG: hypothetical protein QM764_24455 [Chitinophagaceae bacterium]